MAKGHQMKAVGCRKRHTRRAYGFGPCNNYRLGGGPIGHQCHRGHLEEAAHLVEDLFRCPSVQGGCADTGDKPGFESVPDGLRPVPGSQLHAQTDQNRTDHQDDQVDKCLAVPDEQRLVGGGEEPVREQKGAQRGQQCRADPADDRHEEDRQHVGKQHRLTGGHLTDSDQHGGERGQTSHRHGIPDQAPLSRETSVGARQPWAWLRGICEHAAQRPTRRFLLPPPFGCGLAAANIDAFLTPHWHPLLWRHRSFVRVTAPATAPTLWPRLTQALGHPVRVVVGGFAAAILLGTALLRTPVASHSGESADLVTALFTATSAVCVTGLVVVDTAGYWSTFGEVTILLLIQIGGLGIMTLGSLFVIMIGSRLGMRASMLSSAEARTDPGTGRSPREVVLAVIRTSLLVEAALAAVLALRFALAYGQSPGAAAYHGIFHAISAFNNAGFGLRADSLEDFVGDPLVSLTIAAAIVLGGLGFPVLWELRREWRMPRLWSLHTRITVVGTALLLVLGAAVFTAVEWTNQATLGGLPAPQRLLAGFFHSVNTRTAGFNSLPTGELRPESLLASDVLMFIGGGSAGTAGGIKVTTFVILGFVLWAELRGETNVSIWRRRLPADVQRQALTVALLSVGAVVAGTWLLLALTPHPLEAVLFETISAFGTVGLSTGITAQLAAPAELVLTTLMFLGRVGPLTLGAALALRSRPRRYQFPEERAIVG